MVATKPSFCRALVALCLSAAVLSCGSNSPKSSSASNWLFCESDAECEAEFPGSYCSSESVCVDRDGEPLPTPSSRPDGSDASPTVSVVRSDGGASASDQETDPAGDSSAEGGADTSNETSNEGAPATPPVCSPATPGEWAALAAPDVGWPASEEQLFEGFTGTNLPPWLISGAIGDSLYVLHVQRARLFELDTCSGSWSEHDVDWTDAVGRLPMAWIEGRFVTPDGIALDPADGSVVVLPETFVLTPPQLVEWPDPPSAADRMAPSASNDRYTLYFGGVISTLVSEREAGMPVSLVMGDGQVLDRWTGELRPTSRAGAPSPRLAAKVLALDDRFLVWGGFAESSEFSAIVESELRDGAIYDPATDTWTQVTSVGAPVQPEGEGRSITASAGTMRSHWTGTEVVLLRGTPAALYDPRADRWRPIEGGHELMGGGVTTPSGDYLELRHDGTYLLDVAEARVRRLDVEPVPPGLPPSVQGENWWGFTWKIDTWVNGKRVLWGAERRMTSGCENPSPNVGCDPLYQVFRYSGGGILAVDEDGGTAVNDAPSAPSTECDFDSCHPERCDEVGEPCCDPLPGDGPNYCNADLSCGANGCELQVETTTPLSQPFSCGDQFCTSVRSQYCEDYLAGDATEIQMCRDMPSECPLPECDCLLATLPEWRCSVGDRGQLIMSPPPSP